MPGTAQQAMTTIDAFLQQVGAIKSAEEAHTEAGGYEGPTTHPIKNVDDYTQEATEGARSKENTKDVKEDQGEPSVDSTPEAKPGGGKSAFDLAARFAKRAEGEVSTPGSAADDQLQIGTNVQATGDDPKNETAKAKAGKDDKRQGNRGGTSHPASTENNALDGFKYAADMPLEKLAAAMQESGEKLCAQIAWFSHDQKTAADAQAMAGPQTKQAELDPRLAQQAGYELAGLVNGTFDKRAADQMVQSTLEQVIATADLDAVKTAHFLDNYFGAQKQADGPPPTGGGPGPDGGGPGPGPDGAGGDPDAMMAALGGGGAPPDAGGAPPDAGGPSGGDPQVMELAAILHQLGVTPEEFEQAMQQMGGPAGGEPPPDAGGPPPDMGGAPPGAAPPDAKAAGDRHGEKAAEMRNYITEVIQRSRRARAGR